MKTPFASILFCFLLLPSVGGGQGIIPYQCNSPFYENVILFDIDSRANGRNYFLSEGYDKYYKEKKVKGIYVIDSVGNIVFYFKLNALGKLKESLFNSFYNSVKVYHANDTERTVVSSEFHFKGGILLQKDSIVIKWHRYEHLDSIINLENCRLYSYKKGSIINERNKRTKRNAFYKPKKLYLCKRQDFVTMGGFAHNFYFNNDELKNHFFVLNKSRRNFTKSYVEGEFVSQQPKDFYALDDNLRRWHAIAMEKSTIVFTKNVHNLNDTVYWDYYPNGRGIESKENQRILLYTFRYEYFNE